MNPSELQPGYRLDRYELLCPLAYGGMASVWLARFGGRLGFERMVVIKMILPQFSQDPRFQEMFLDEARIASRIEHPNVARILDVGEEEDNYFIVMEWVDGDSLSKILRAAEMAKETIPMGVAMRIIADAAAGLHAAHELKDRDGKLLGVVHRDVSPQNILVANNGAAMIIDFGVAKARDRVSQDTSAGQLKGKIRYMAPEQALGRAIDHRADVWALGAMLYEMFAGQSPYEGPNEVATLHKLTSGHPIPPLPRHVPPAVRNVIERALAADPRDRFATAMEMNLALEDALVAINELTTPATVGAYTGTLLAERKLARRRAVENALEAARARDVPLPRSSKSVKSMRAADDGSFSETHLAAYTPGQAVQAYAESPSHPSQLSHPSHASYPSRVSSPSNNMPSMTGPHQFLSISEVPSAASSTLGSAAVEYGRDGPVDDSASRRRGVLAVWVGVAAAFAAIGAALLITNVLKGPPQTVESASPTFVPVPIPTEGPAVLAADAGEIATAVPPTATVAITGTVFTPPPQAPLTTPSRPVTPPQPHRPPPPPPPAPKPAVKPPAPAPTSNTKDRGF